MDFIKLFEEDSKKNQGEFVTMIYAQHLREITAYDAEVTAAIRSVGKGARCLLAVARGTGGRSTRRPPMRM